MLSCPRLRLFLRPFELPSLLERQRFRVCVQEVGFSLICDARGWMGPLAIMYRDTWFVDHCSEDSSSYHPWQKTYQIISRITSEVSVGGARDMETLAWCHPSYASTLVTSVPLVSQFKSIKSGLTECMAPSSTVESSSNGIHGAVLSRIGLAPQPPAHCWSHTRP